MEIITLNSENLHLEDICCAKAKDKKNAEGERLKKEWLKERFSEGLVFKKMNASAKIFIEYIPAEKAWRPIDAPGYMFIHCIWVSGSAQKHGYGSRLLDECIRDSQDKEGIAIITSKKPYMPDKGFFIKKGFEVCDIAHLYFELLVKKLKKDAPSPKFKDNAKKGIIDNKDGFTLLFTDQCPFSANYVNEMTEVAKSRNIPIKTIKIESANQAQDSPSPYGTFGVFYNGSFVSHEIMSKNKFNKFLDSILREEVKR